MKKLAKYHAEKPETQLKIMRSHLAAALSEITTIRMAVANIEARQTDSIEREMRDRNSLGWLETGGFDDPRRAPAYPAHHGPACSLGTAGHAVHCTPEEKPVEA